MSSTAATTVETPAKRQNSDAITFRTYNCESRQFEDCNEPKSSPSEPSRNFPNRLRIVRVPMAIARTLRSEPEQPTEANEPYGCAIRSDFTVFGR